MVQRWLIVGSNRGIGLGLAKEIIRSQPNDIVFATARNITAATDLHELAESTNGRLIPIQADFNNAKLIPKTVEDVKEHSTSLDHVVVVAGTMCEFKPIENQTGESLSEILNVNAVSAHRAIQALYPLVKASESNQRTIAVISSVAASLGFLEANIERARAKLHFDAWPLNTYAISKTALNMISRQWALRLEPEGIFMPSIEPGAVQSDMSKAATGLITPQQSAAFIIKSIKDRDFEKARRGMLSERNGVVEW